MQKNRTELFGREPPIQRNKSRTNPDASKEKLGHFVPVAGDDSNALSAANSHFAQQRCPTVTGSVKLGVSLPRAFRSIDERDSIRS